MILQHRKPISVTEVFTPEKLTEHLIKWTKLLYENLFWRFSYSLTLHSNSAAELLQNDFF